MTTATTAAIDPIYAATDALVEDIAALRPVNATFMGVTGHDHEWDDFSPDGMDQYAATLRDWRKRVTALPPASDRWGALARDVTIDWLDLELESYDVGAHKSDLNSIASPFQLVRGVFDTMDLGSIEGWTNAAQRLETLPAALASYRACLAAGMAEGEVVATRQVNAAIGQGRVHAGDEGFFHNIPASFDGAAVDDAALRNRLVDAIPGAKAAFAAFSDWLETHYLPHARQRDGVGRERYQRELRRFLGTTVDLESTLEWGWQEIHTLQRRLRETAEAIAPGAAVAEVLELVKTDPSRAAPDRATFLAVMRERQQRALAALDGVHFDVPDEIRRIDVKEAPPGGPLGAYYVPPSEDFRRPGTVWYSLDGDGPVPLWDEVSTAYHEGFPGHHLQCGLQVSFTRSLCRLHRVAFGYSGYAEGWALYTEELMEELGFYEKPDYLFGMLANQMFRACRVVFDIGAHCGFTIPGDAPIHPGQPWTFERGVDMMQTLGGMAKAYAESEVTRYLGWPGQAPSYKLGQRVILELRDAYRARQGAAGSLKDFHARVLSSGNVGLDVLRRLVLDPDNQV